MSNSESNIIPAAVVSFEGHPEKLRACLHALSSWVSPIIIIHSESDKRVKQIAEEFKVLTSVCPSQATNANWSAGLSKINKQWVLLMRSNEVITGQLRNTIVEKINHTEGTSCQYALPLTLVFLKKRLKYALDWNDSKPSCLVYRSNNTDTISQFSSKYAQFNQQPHYILGATHFEIEDGVIAKEFTVFDEVAALANLMRKLPQATEA